MSFHNPAIKPSQLARSMLELSVQTAFPIKSPSWSPIVQPRLGLIKCKLVEFTEILHSTANGT